MRHFRRAAIGVGLSVLSASVVLGSDHLSFHCDGEVEKSGSRDVDASGKVELDGEEGRIHLSDALVPPIHSGGSHGWWELRDVRVSRDQIKASYELNGANQPKVVIDRGSWRIAIDGLEHFRGRCDGSERHSSGTTKPTGIATSTGTPIVPRITTARPPAFR